MAFFSAKFLQYRPIYLQFPRVHLHLLTYSMEQSPS
jgi:hypothetical protein